MWDLEGAHPLGVWGRQEKKYALMQNEHSVHLLE